MQEMACLKNSRHPSILLCLGATLHKGELFLVKSKPPEDAIKLSDFLLNHDATGPAIYKVVYDLVRQVTLTLHYLHQRGIVLGPKALRKESFLISDKKVILASMEGAMQLGERIEKRHNMSMAS